MNRTDMVWPERRTERLHIRVAPEFKRHVEEAAREAGMNLSDFVVSAIRQQADDVLARRTVVTEDYFDRLVAALDEPPRVVPELLDALQKRTAADA